jgi:hypothetical protein
MRMTTYELFLCWIIVMLLVMIVGEASIIKVRSNLTIYGSAIVACSARAVSSYAAAPPSSAMNSRRCMLAIESPVSGFSAPSAQHKTSGRLCADTNWFGVHRWLGAVLGDCAFSISDRHKLKNALMIMATIGPFALAGLVAAYASTSRKSSVSVELARQRWKAVLTG